MSRTVRGGIYFIIIQIIGLGTGVLTQKVLGILLSPEGYGAFGLIVSFTMIVSTVLTAGIPRAASRFVAINPERRIWVKKRIQSMQGGLTIAVLAGYILAAPIVASWILPMGERGAILVAALMIPAESINILYLNLLNGLQEYHKQGTARLTYFTAKAFFAITLVVAGFRLYGALAGFVMGSAFSLLVEYFYWKKVTESNSKNDSNEIEDFSRQVLAFSAPLVMYSTLNLVFMNIDMFVIRGFLGYYDSGVYYASKNIGQIPYQALIAAASAVFPAMSSIHDRGEDGEFGFYASLTMRYLFFMIVPAALFMVVFSDKLLLLIYSAEYLAGDIALKLLSIAFLVSVCSSFLNTLLMSTGQTKAIVGAISISVMAHLAGCYLFVPVQGIIGAGISWIIASVILFSALAGVLLYRKGAIIPWRVLAKCLLAILPGVFIFILAENFSEYVIFAVSVIIYLLLVHVMKAVKFQELLDLAKAVLKIESSQES